jgi:TPR repeat protein
VESREDCLFDRAVDILEGRANGFGLPILHHLALRGHSSAMLWLAGAWTQDAERSKFGRFSDPCSAIGLMRRALRLGDSNGAQNLAMTYYFNTGNLAMYRHWLAKAATRGDEDAARELSRFELRLPHLAARRVGRLRPLRRDERG